MTFNRDRLLHEAIVVSKREGSEGLGRRVFERWHVVRDKEDQGIWRGGLADGAVREGWEGGCELGEERGGGSGFDGRHARYRSVWRMGRRWKTIVEK